MVHRVAPSGAPSAAVLGEGHEAVRLIHPRTDRFAVRGYRRARPGHGSAGPACRSLLCAAIASTPLARRRPGRQTAAGHQGVRRRFELGQDIETLLSLVLAQGRTRHAKVVLVSGGGFGHDAVLAGPGLDGQRPMHDPLQLRTMLHSLGGNTGTWVARSFCPSCAYL